MPQPASVAPASGVIVAACKDRRAYLLIALLALFVSSFGILLHGPPLPHFHDEFTYLFAGETFSSFRLTNPSPPSPESFWSPHLLVEPTFSSKYPPAQGLFLAIGFWLGHPAIGLVLGGLSAATALLCAMRALVSPMPALAGAVLFVVSVLSTGTWIRSYMGGLVAFACAALVFSFFLRLRTGVPGKLHFLALGAGVGGLFLSRPFEGAVVCFLCALAYAGPSWRAICTDQPGFWRGALVVVVPVLLAIGFQGILNRAVTGSAWRMPYSEYHSQYMNQPIFVWGEVSPASKPSPRIVAVEDAQLASGSWALRVQQSVVGAAYSTNSIGGSLLGWLILTGFPALAFGQGRLLLVIVSFPLLHAFSNYLLLNYYFAAIAPAWFLAIAMLFGLALDRRPWFWLVAPLMGALLVSLLVHRVLVPPSGHSFRHRADLVQALAERPPSLIFVTYAPGTNPELDIVYNDPRLRNHSLFVRELDEVANCTVLRAFDGRQLWRAEVTDVGINAHIVDPAIICSQVPATATAAIN